MSDHLSSRRNFLKTLGLTTGAALTGNGALANIINNEEVLRLNEEQQKFMLRYGRWMDEYMAVIRIMNSEPENLDNHRKMMMLAEEAHAWQPVLFEYMKEEKFAAIYHASIGEMKSMI